MTHTLFKHPLEIWWDAVIWHLLFAAAWVGIDKLLKRKTVAKTYHGAALVIQGYGSGKHQEVLAAAIVWARGPRTARCTDPAIFIQKLREWTDYNISRGKTDIRPYYSYQEWCDEHFPCHNEASMQRMVQSLEELGLITTEQFSSRDLRKRYALNEQAISALMSRWELAFPETARKFRGEMKGLASESKGLSSESNRFASESKGFDTARHTSSKKSFNQPEIKSGLHASAHGAAPIEPLALIETDSDSHASVEANAPAQERQDKTSLPSSETPLSQIDEDAVRRWKYAHINLSSKSVEFKRWLEKATLRGYACIDGLVTYRVTVPDAYAQDQLQHRYYRNVVSEFSWQHDRPVKIEFEVGT